MKHDKPKNQSSKTERKGILIEDTGKRTPPGPTGYYTENTSRISRPEQGPDIPPHERTEGIP